jgi:hypothetical protein
LTVRPARSPLDLVATLGLALLGLVVALLPAASWVRVTVLIPLVFALPGYAVGCALLPSRTIPAAERGVYTVALSVAICALSGVLVQLVLSLGRASWAILLTLITVTASVTALRRRRPLAWRRRPRATIATPPPASILAIVVAVGIAAWAISVASAGARKDRVHARFSELWVVPAKAPQPGGDSVSIGVENHQGVPVSYVIQTQHGTLFTSQPVRLSAGGRWHTRLLPGAISSADPLRVTLLREGAVYRRAYLDSGLRP